MRLVSIIIAAVWITHLSHRAQQSYEISLYVQDFQFQWIY